MPVSIADACVATPAAASGGRDAILLVEDDDMVASLLTCMLERGDWRVFRAGDGAECEQLVAQHGPAILFAFVDCGLPDTDGASLCERLRVSQPGLPVLLTSGRECSSLVEALAAGGPTVFLPKPFMPADVARHVQSLLAQVG